MWEGGLEEGCEEGGGREGVREGERGEGVREGGSEGVEREWRGRE